MVKDKSGASPAVQWLRIHHFEVQGTLVRSPIRKDRTCCEQLGPWTTTLEPGNHNYWACVQQLLKRTCSRAGVPQRKKPPQWKSMSCRLEKPPFAATRESPWAATETQKEIQEWGENTTSGKASTGKQNHYSSLKLEFKWVRSANS